MRPILVLVMAAMLVVVATGAALAARGGKGGGPNKSGSGLNLVLLNSTDGLPHWGQDITFEVNTNAAEPSVNVRCYQGPAFVYDGWGAFWAGAWFGQTFTLSSQAWPGGDADCIARLVTFGSNGRERTLATMSFHVFA